MKIGILTSFWEFNNSYSLCSVVESQLKALVKYGYNTTLYVHDNFADDEKVPYGVKIKKIVPRFQLEDYSNHHQVNGDFDRQVNEAYSAFKQIDDDIILEHDLIFQGWFLPYCVAIHKLAKESKIKWFHWIHSVPNLMPKGLEYPHTLRYQLPANSKLVYLNNNNLIRAAEAYSIWPKDVRIVFNSVDPRLFWKIQPLTEQIINKYPVLEADFLQVYPVSSTRMVDGKQIKVVIEIFAHLKKLGYKVCLIVPNAHANADREKQTIQELLDYSSKLGLLRTEVIFTSLEAKEWELGVPKEVVSDLFKLSNLFIFPTRSENCPLILLEAMLSGCILILNNSVPALREFGQDNALYFNFGALDQQVNIDNRDKYMEDIAKIIITELNNNKALKGQNLIKQKFNIDYIFRKSIEPLFSEQ